MTENPSDIVDRLARHRTLGGAPREELEWLAAHGRLYRVEQGDYVTRAPHLVETMVVLLSGHLAIRVDRGLGPRKVMEWGPGDVSGHLPYSRMGKAPGEGMFDEAGEVFAIHREHFANLIKACPTVTAALVHLMLDRARRFTSSDLQDEKMASLGRLSAGLAHELNNPASAAARSARVLIDGLTDLEEASRVFGAARLSDAQLAVVNRSRRACHSAAAAALSPLERADREEAIASWLEQHDVSADVAAALVDTQIAFEDLEALAAALDRDALTATLRWMAADCATRALVTDVERAATRVHDLVAAVKRFSYMDRTSVPEAIDLAQGLNDAVALLLHKARTKSVRITVSLEPNLPRVRAIGGDLNQIWTNLIDNALDAAPPSSLVAITAARRVDFVIVRVVDDGEGIPSEIGERIFDPFYTTKPVGQGTGLGLDVARRLARRNDGDIEFESRPGRTEFRVTLPVAS